MTMNTMQYLTLVLFLLTAGSCTAQPSVRELNAVQFEQALNGGDQVQLVDVRTASEYASGHLSGARLMDWSNGQLQNELSTLDKEQPVLLYCASGMRSDAALQALHNAGFNDVKHLLGGIRAWSKAGKLLVR